MLTRTEHQYITQTRPDTLMGNLFRRSWIPALLVQRGVHFDQGSRELIVARIWALETTAKALALRLALGVGGGKGRMGLGT